MMPVIQTACENIVGLKKGVLYGKGLVLVLVFDHGLMSYDIGLLKSFWEPTPP